MEHWKLPRILVILLASLCLRDALAATPSLLLTPQRLKRLKRDQERQTPRWVNFENRVKTETASPERGFELALYYAVTGDESSAREAVRWVKTHPCEHRQSALAHDWIDGHFFDEDKGPGLIAQCVVQPGKSVIEWRDSVIRAAAAGKPCDLDAGRHAIHLLQDGAYRDPAQLYAAVEALYLIKSLTKTDLREESPKFFSSLPTLMLLTLRPSQVENPHWLTHIASIALVSLDPNSNGAQFLQGWAIEDRHMLRDGPGMAYELLWADPYLPGVGYQNLDPWVFDDETGALVARANWTPDACWINVTAHDQTAEHCPPGWDRRKLDFGHLALIPMLEKCADVTRTPNESIILSRLAPGQKIRYDDGGGRMETASASPTGLWRVPVNAVKKACLAR